MPIIRLPAFAPLTIVDFLLLLLFILLFFTFRSGQSCYESAVYQLTQREMIFFSLHEPQNTTLYSTTTTTYTMYNVQMYIIMNH